MFQWKCEDCNETYYECEKTYRRLPGNEITARSRLLRHLRACKEAQVLKGVEDVKAVGTRGYCNCPVCNEVKRADKLQSHCLAKHKEELALSMTNELRKSLRDVSLPVLIGYQPYSNSKTGVKCVFGCLHCKKGSFIHTKRPDEFDVSLRYLLHAHKGCIPHFKDYEAYLADVSETEHTLLPFQCRKLTDKDLHKASAPDTVLEVKEPSADTFEASTRILDLKEEVARLKAELEEERKKKLMSETVKEQLIEIVEPEEDLGDEDLIEKAVREYKKIQRRKAIADDKYAGLLETMRDAKDALQNLLDADEDIYEIIRRSCTKEQVHALETILKTT